MLLVLLAVVLGIAFLIYRSRVTPATLQVDPHAAREIEKAKRR